MRAGLTDHPAPRSFFSLAAVLLVFALAGCATRPVNPRIEHFDATTTYTFQRPSESPEDRQHLVLLAFSGGGMGAAAFSYGVLETLRDMEITTPSGRKVRALDEVDVITAVSGLEHVEFPAEIAVSRDPRQKRGSLGTPCSARNKRSPRQRTSLLLTQRSGPTAWVVRGCAAECF